jgi:hypothetical protein
MPYMYMYSYMHVGRDNLKMPNATIHLSHSCYIELLATPADEIGDLALALDEISKDLACQVIGKDEEYEFGDLSREVDARIKNVVAGYCGKDTYEGKFRCVLLG